MNSIPERLGAFMMAIDGPCVSRHLDEILGPSNVNHIAYGEWCVKTFAEMVRFMRSNGEVRNVIWGIPLSFTSKICCVPIGVNKVQTEITPSSVHLVTTEDIFIEADEEYRKALAVPQISDFASAVFRSWRDLDAAKLNAEFINHIYLIAMFTGPEK